MKEIKFRGWNSRIKRMYYPELYNAFNGLQLPGNDCYDYSETASIYKQGFSELMLFTGMRDKDKKEIYRGDKVIIDTISDKKRTVVFRDGCFKIEHEGKNGIISYHIDNFSSKELQVVGNIFEK